MISVSELYSAVDYYFDSPSFVKIKNIDVHTVYMCKLNICLGNMTRYLVCITDRDAYLVGDVLPLSAIKWRVFQTRSLKDSYPLLKTKHSYVPKHGGIFNSLISKTTSTADRQTDYNSETIPILVTLLEADKNMFNYPESGTLNSAFETYNTIIKLV